MKDTFHSVDDYIEHLPKERQEVIQTLRQTINDNLPEGFEEQLTYNMIGFVVPLSLYPQGYHVKKNEPLPFISLASQKHYIALYHMGIYGMPDIHDWFVQAYTKAGIGKLDMGKSCIRFRKMDKIPYDLIAELCQKISVREHIAMYEKSR